MIDCLCRSGPLLEALRIISIRPGFVKARAPDQLDLRRKDIACSDLAYSSIITTSDALADQPLGLDLNAGQTPNLKDIPVPEMRSAQTNIA